jgi:two-component system sensor histidine kinase KdpD
MTRLEAGSVFLNIQWHVLEEIVGSARVALRDLLAQHVVRSRLPADLPLILVDGVLLEQVFITLLENAGRYTPAGSVIEISAQVVPGAMRIEVTDDGPGLAPGTESQAFRKFFRGGVEQRPDRRRGVGLGLAICRAIVEAHGGSMTAHNRPQGGAAFVMMLPCREPAPRVALDESATVAGSAAL